MKIIIIGCGWYGLHTYIYLKENTKNDIILLEKENEIFNNSSFYNQNRLHMGYHYPRSSSTRKLCLDGYYKFLDRYKNIVDDIQKNYYLISSNSFIDYETYLNIFYKYNFEIIDNNFFKNIDGNIINTNEKVINTNEKVINTKKAKQYFNSKIDYKDLKLSYNVKNIIQKNNKVIINNHYECDLLIDCTYNNLNLSKQKYLYEITISLIYECKNNCLFDSITIMDGNFFSIYPRDLSNNEYTLTHVKYTPLITTSNIETIHNYIFNENNLKNIIVNMETDVLKVFSNFKEKFKYKDYFLSYKCKSINNNDNRNCNIEQNKNIISVNCGKITGIFEFEKYIKKKLNIL
jgi:hypothetical protein